MIARTVAEANAFDAGYFQGKAEGQSALAKLASILLLEEKIAELEKQNTALQAHNTELLTRARKAEAQIVELEQELEQTQIAADRAF